jgi:hypothetical protein
MAQGSGPDTKNEGARTATWTVFPVTLTAALLLTIPVYFIRQFPLAGCARARFHAGGSERRALAHRGLPLTVLQNIPI